MYKKLTSHWVNRSFKHLWKAKIPPKIKILLWMIWHNAVTTKNNMMKRGWIGDRKCRYCVDDEDIHYLFFLCPMAKYMWSVVSITLGARDRPGNFTEYFHWILKHAGSFTNVHVVGVTALCWALWKLRNRACFEKKLIKSPAEIICYASSF
jgi:hypothetical protein